MNLADLLRAECKRALDATLQGFRKVPGTQRGTLSWTRTTGVSRKGSHHWMITEDGDVSLFWGTYK